MRTPNQILAPDFVTAENLAKTPGVNLPSQYSNHGASIAALYDVIDAIGASKYQLGRLLGMAYPVNVYGYFSGRRRPSQLMLTRALGLLELHRAGVQFAWVRGIDWEAGTITWRNGSVTLAQCEPGEPPPKGRPAHPL